jgi:hypothetical protein
MDRVQFLQAMRDRDPEEFKRLGKLGELEQSASMKVAEANRVFEELAKGQPRDNSGNLPLNVEREIWEIVDADMLEFSGETTEAECETDSESA